MSSQEGKSDKGHREAGGHVQTEVETGGVWLGARNTWSSWGLERGVPQSSRRLALLPDTLILNFQLLEQQGKESMPGHGSTRQDPAHLALVISSVLAKWGSFLEVGIRYWPSVLLHVLVSGDCNVLARFRLGCCFRLLVSPGCT